jgi:hypothetical protein
VQFLLLNRFDDARAEISMYALLRRGSSIDQAILAFIRLMIACSFAQPTHILGETGQAHINRARTEGQKRQETREKRNGMALAVGALTATRDWVKWEPGRSQVTEVGRGYHLIDKKHDASNGRRF